MRRKINKSEMRWYGSKKHFETEMSYEEYMASKRKKRRYLGI